MLENGKKWVTWGIGDCKAEVLGKNKKIVDSYSCPRGTLCQETASICGKCVISDVAGNIMFGVLGGISTGKTLESLLEISNIGDAANGKYLNGDDPEDKVAIRVGYRLYTDLFDDMNGKLNLTVKNFCQTFLNIGGLRTMTGDFIKCCPCVSEKKGIRIFRPFIPPSSPE